MSLKNWFIKQQLKIQKDELSKLSIVERRKRFELTMSNLVNPIKAITDDVKLDNNIRGRFISQSKMKKECIILYFHGGGFCMGTLDSYLNPCIDIVNATKMKLFLPEYRLAPENPFPCGLYDCVKAYDYLLSLGYKSENIVFIGDSAGANLALSTVLVLKKRNAKLPSCMVLLSPCTMVEMHDDDRIYDDMEKRDVLLSAKILRLWTKAYCQGSDSKDPFVSPIYANLTGFPPILINIGTDDMLLDSARLFHTRALDFGVDSTFLVNEGHFHAYQLLHYYIPEAQVIMKSISKFVNKHLTH